MNRKRLRCGLIVLLSVLHCVSPLLIPARAQAEPQDRSIVAVLQPGPVPGSAVSLEKPELGLGVIVNMVKNEKEAVSVYGKFNEIVERFLQRGVVFHGAIVSDNTVSQAVMRQMPLALYAGKSPAMQCIRRIARNLLGLEKTKPKTLFNR